MYVEMRYTSISQCFCKVLLLYLTRHFTFSDLWQGTLLLFRCLSNDAYNFNSFMSYFATQTSAKLDVITLWQQLQLITTLHRLKQLASWRVLIVEIYVHSCISRGCDMFAFTLPMVWVDRPTVVYFLIDIVPTNVGIARIFWKHFLTTVSFCTTLKILIMSKEYRNLVTEIVINFTFW